AQGKYHPPERKPGAEDASKKQEQAVKELADGNALGGRSGATKGEKWNGDEPGFDLKRGTVPVAQATKLGDYFQYVIDRPVSLPRQKSALLPIVGKEVEGTRVSIYNERTQAKFPLLGLKLKNTSGLHLMQGPVTVFEGSSYAGD